MGINRVLTGLYKSKPAKTYMNWSMDKNALKSGVERTGQNYSKLQKIYPPVFMCFLALVQSIFLAKSKDMSKDRKYPLIFNNIYSCIIALGIGAAFGKPVNKMTEKLVSKAVDIYGKDSKMINGIKTGVPILKEAFLFEYVGYVAAVPLGTQTTAFLAKKGIIKLDDKTQKK